MTNTPSGGASGNSDDDWKSPVVNDNRALARTNAADSVALYEPMLPAPEDTRVDFSEYIRLLIKHRILIGATIGAFVAVAVIFSILSTRIYTATATIQIEPKAMKIVSENADVVQNNSMDRDFLQTQIQLLSSRRLAERVVTQMKLTQDDDFMGRNHFSVFSAIRSLFTKSEERSSASEVQRATNKIMLNTSISPYPLTSVVRIRISDGSPQRSRDIANAMAEGYVALNLDRRVEATAYARKFLEDQLSQLKLKLELSERELIAYAQKEQIISLDKHSLLETRLAAASKELGEATADRIKHEEIWRTAQRAQDGALSSVVENKLIQDLREKRATLASDYQEKLGNFKPDFPTMVQMRGRINELDRQVKAEVSNIKQSLNANYQTALQREGALSANVESLKESHLDLQKRSVQYTILQREIDTSRSLYNDLLNRYKEVGVAGNTGVNNVSVLDRALAPVSPTSPNVFLNLMISLVAGIIIGIALAFIRDRVDDRLKSPEEVEQATKLVTVGVIPRFVGEGGALEALSDPHSAVSEAYRSLATSLQFSTSLGLPKSLSVTSSGPSEAKSTTAWSIARHYSNIGLRVLLVDCDLRKPSMHKLLALPNHIGVSSYLTGTCKGSEAIQTTSYPNLSFMSSGPLPPNPAELISGPKFQTLITVASQHFDLVIIDGPPVMGLADAPIIASKASATIIVVAAGQCSRMALRKSLERLRYTRAALLGTVMTKFDAKSAGYGYGYGYSYGEEYGYSYGTKQIANEKLPKAS